MVPAHQCELAPVMRPCFTLARSRSARWEVLMRRREVLALLGSAAAWPLAARAQHPGHIRRIGVLMSMDEGDPEGQAHLAGFTQALSELGWRRGRNLEMEVRWGSADVNRIRTFAKELAAVQPDL